MEYGLSEKESKASDSFLLAAFLNLAMCYLKLREYAKAVECCDKVEVHEPGGWSIFSSCMFSLGVWGLFLISFRIRSHFQAAVGWWHPFCTLESLRMLRARRLREQKCFGEFKIHLGMCLQELFFQSQIQVDGCCVDQQP